MVKLPLGRAWLNRAGAPHQQPNMWRKPHLELSVRIQVRGAVSCRCVIRYVAAVTLYSALEHAGLALLTDLTSTSVKVINHRYGAEAGSSAEHGVFSMPSFRA